MVLRLGAAIQPPLREIDQLLLGVALAPAYPDARVDHTARTALLSLLDDVLDGHLPNPRLSWMPEFDVVAVRRFSQHQ